MVAKIYPRIVLALTAGSLMFAGAAMAAQPRGERVDRMSTQAMAQPPVQQCVPWCAQDYQPCDPDYFKKADGRCNDVSEH